MNLPDGLEKQIGPFSVAAWLGIGAAGVGLGIVIRRSSLFKTETPAPTIDVTGDDPTGVYVPPPGMSVGLAPSLAPPPSPAPAGRPRPTDNQEWAVLAIEYLLTQGQNPAAAQSAIETFLRELPLTEQQAAIVSMAIRALGPPPYSVAPIEIRETPGTTPATPGTNMRGIDLRSLVNAGNTAYVTGSEDYRPYLAELVRRLNAGEVNINHDQAAWKDASGQLLPIGEEMLRTLFAQGWKPADMPIDPR